MRRVPRLVLRVPTTPRRWTSVICCTTDRRLPSRSTFPAKADRLTAAHSGEEDQVVQVDQPVVGDVTKDGLTLRHRPGRRPKQPAVTQRGRRALIPAPAQSLFPLLGLRQQHRLSHDPDRTPVNKAADPDIASNAQHEYGTPTNIESLARNNQAVERA